MHKISLKDAKYHTNLNPFLQKEPTDSRRKPNRIERENTVKSSSSNLASDFLIF